MTPQEICERLKAEFPGRRTALDVECVSGSYGELSVSMAIYHEDAAMTRCTTVEEGIRLLKNRLEHAVEPPVGADVEVPA